MSDELNRAYSEVYEILKHMDSKYIKKIPRKLIETFENKKDKNHIIKIDVNKSLESQNISNKALQILAILNLNYWCEDENEKRKLLQMYAENDRINEERAREKYNPDNIFKNRRNSIKKDYEVENRQMIECKKQNLFGKVWDRIMKFFIKNR